MSNKKEFILKKRKFKQLTKDEMSIRRDQIFKLVFGSNERSEFLKDLLESILHKKITNIVIRNEVSLSKIHINNKDVRLDILAEIERKRENKYWNAELERV